MSTVAVTTEIFGKRGPSPVKTCINQPVLLSQDEFKLLSENYLPGGYRVVDDLCPTNSTESKHFQLASSSFI